MEARRSPRTITEEVYQDIRLKILQNKFAPNEHLVERRLAELYGVSKTPVREAITRLERDGLVKFISLKGAVVRRLEKPEIIQILDIREYLEALAGRKAAERSRSSVFIKEIEAAHALSLRYLDNIEEFQMHDRLLHTTIRKASGNQFLFDMSERLDDLFHIVLKTSMVLPTRGPSIAYMEHEYVVRAIVAGNPDEAEEQSRRHIMAIRKSVEKFYNNQ